jgi:hypothetical protein
MQRPFDNFLSGATEFYTTSARPGISSLTHEKAAHF